MGNAEMRLTFASLESEIADIKDIAIETRDQAKKTNGRVNKHEKLLFGATIALGLLTPWAGWLTYQQLYPPERISQEDIESAVLSGVQKALQDYETE